MVRRGKKRSRERGAYLVEFALVFPLFLLLVMGIVELGRYFFVQHTIQFATREGMRLATVGTRLNDQSGHAMTREASVIQRIKEKSAVAIDPTRLSIYIYPVAADFSDPANWQDLPPDAGISLQYMRIRTRYTFRFVTPLIGAFFPTGGVQIEAQTTYRNEVFN